MKSVTYVTVLGHEYPIEAEAGDELYVNRLAQFVEERMKELKGGSHVVDSYKLAVLAAMNIADDLFKLQESKGSNSKLSDTKAESLLALIQKELAATVKK